MPKRWYVSLDPDAMAGGTGWLYVVVRAETGVIYQQQYGGTACRQGQVEGFLVPVFGPKGLSLLRELFEGHFGGAGTWRYRWQADELDEQHLSEADEAWIPVRTPDGPGILVWFNSD